MVLTALISFFAVMIIPDNIRSNFQDNLISGLAMHVVGPQWARLGLNTLVVVVGFLILAGAVNTSIVGSNGVLNRITEDGVLPDWFQKPQRTYGTTWRLLTLIAGLQVATIVLSGGNVIVLGEAYAFGVIWSLVFKALSMLMLRFTEPDRYRGYRVPLNIRLGRVELPVGLSLVFLVLLAAALANLLTKTVATISGAAFAGAFLMVFAAAEHTRKRQDGDQAERGRRGHEPEHEHLEQFEVSVAEDITPEALDWIGRTARSSRSVSTAISRCSRRACWRPTRRAPPSWWWPPTLPAEAGSYGEPEQTEILDTPRTAADQPDPPLGHADRKLMTAVVNRSELAGKPVKPIVILTDEPETALLRTVRAVGAEELLLGPSATESPDALLDRIVGCWRQQADSQPPRLTIRLIAQDRDERRDIGGGSRIPRAADDGETARAWRDQDRINQ